jgi:hypothetical protein
LHVDDRVLENLKSLTVNEVDIEVGEWREVLLVCSDFGEDDLIRLSDNILAMYNLRPVNELTCSLNCSSR